MKSRRRGSILSLRRGLTRNSLILLRKLIAKASFSFDWMNVLFFLSIISWLQKCERCAQAKSSESKLRTACLIHSSILFSFFEPVRKRSVSSPGYNIRRHHLIQGVVSSEVLESLASGWAAETYLGISCVKQSLKIQREPRSDFAFYWTVKETM